MGDQGSDFERRHCDEEANAQPPGPREGSDGRTWADAGLTGSELVLGIGVTSGAVRVPERPRSGTEPGEDETTASG